MTKSVTWSSLVLLCKDGWMREWHKNNHKWYVGENIKRILEETIRMKGPTIAPTDFCVPSDVPLPSKLAISGTLKPVLSSSASSDTCDICKSIFGSFNVVGLSPATICRKREPPTLLTVSKTFELALAAPAFTVLFKVPLPLPLI